MVVKLGFCCMDAKRFSTPMRAIIDRLRRYEELDVVTFGNSCILETPVERWPIVDFLISFYSAGFPLEKAEKYVRLRNPICINDVLKQHILLDRAAIYQQLKAAGIPVPPYEVYLPDPHSPALAGAASRRGSALSTSAGKPKTSIDATAAAAAAGPSIPLTPSPRYRRTSSSLTSSLTSSPNISGNLASVPPVSTSAEITTGGTGIESSRGNNNSSSGFIGAWRGADVEFKRMLLEGTKVTSLNTSFNTCLASSSARRRGVAEEAAEEEAEETDKRKRELYWGEHDPLQEDDDSITVNGVKITKPFLEKPVYSRDHGVYVYYPRSSGGGSKRVFRKVRDVTSRYYPDVSTVRRDGAYIYQEFVTTDGVDIKVYTVGPDYAHAEMRKAPTVDGRVERENGQEMRRQTILTQQEKEIARKITQVFGQNVCDFSILRTDETSYVCDVNGWSVAKGYPKYYNDCAQILYEMIFHHLHPPTPIAAPSQASRLLEDNDKMYESGSAVEALDAADKASNVFKLRLVAAVIRHADRTPKQKVKVKVSHPAILKFFDGRDPHVQVKLKTVKEMQEFSDTITAIVEAFEGTTPAQTTPAPAAAAAAGDASVTSNMTSSAVPIMTSQGAAGTSLGESGSASGCQLDKSCRSRLREIYDQLKENESFSGINRKVQIKPLHWRASKADESKVEVTQALLIFKYGGQLTEMGSTEADTLGINFRTSFYGDRSSVSLHSSFTNDIKFYASDEGRVQMTAAVFARSLLDLADDEIIPILYALVWNDKRANTLLEHSCSDSSAMLACKRQLAEIVNSDIDFSDANKALDPTQIISGATVEELRGLGLGRIGNPFQTLKRLKAHFDAATAALDQRLSGPDSANFTPAQRTALTKVLKLWKKLTKPFYDEGANRFDISKVPELADGAKYILLHTPPELGVTDIFRSILTQLLPLAQWVSSQEYGIAEGAKKAIAEEVVRPLMDKLIADMTQMRDHRHLKMVSRYYFTSESHLLSLHNLIDSRLGKQMDGLRIEDYIAHFVFKLYERVDIPVTDPNRFTVEIWHSQGSNAVNLQYPPGTPDNFLCPRETIKLGIPLDTFIKLFK